MTFPTGWLPDPPATQPERLLGAGYLSELLESSPSTGTHLSRPPWRIVQGEESCTWMGGTGAAWDLAGVKLSPWCGWYFSRRRDQRTPHVLDRGTTVGSMLWAFERVGACALDDWSPQTPGFAVIGKDSEPPSALVLRTLKLDVAPLYGTRSDVEHGALVALDRGLPVLYTVQAHGQFADGRNGVGPKLSDPRGDNHLVQARGHELVGGERRIITRNTHFGWGEPESGEAPVHSSWLRAATFVAVVRGVRWAS